MGSFSARKMSVHSRPTGETMSVKFRGSLRDSRRTALRNYYTRTITVLSIEIGGGHNWQLSVTANYRGESDGDEKKIRGNRK